MKELRNPFGVVGGKLKHIKHISREDLIICPICGESLIVREGEKTVKHLAHINISRCGGESAIHKIVKQYIYENIELLTIEKFKLDISRYGIYIRDEEEEFRVKKKAIEYRGVSSEYIPDILIKLDGNINIAIEICYKNKKDKNVLAEKLNGTIIDQVYEIVVTNEDIEDMDLDRLLNDKKIIYNSLKIKYVEYIKNMDIKYCEIKDFGKDRIRDAENKVEKCLGENKRLKDENKELLKLNNELEKYKNTDIDKLKWQIEMQKDRIALLLEG